MAHQQKFSAAWWKRHDRIGIIGKRLEQLWHSHRVELAEQAKQQPIEIDRVASDHFYDYRVSLGAGPDGIWRIEDEASHQRRYMHVDEGLTDNQAARYLKPVTKKGSSKPDAGARPRKKQFVAASGVL